MSKTYVIINENLNYSEKHDYVVFFRKRCRFFKQKSKAIIKRIVF
jgi:hypothetical protein